MNLVAGRILETWAIVIECSFNFKLYCEFVSSSVKSFVADLFSDLELFSNASNS